MNVLADVEDTRKLGAFRDEAEAWIRANFPESLKTKLEEYYQNMPRYPDGPDWALWKQRVRDKGWGTPGWPKDYGGGGLPTPEARIVLQAFVNCGAFNPDDRHGHLAARADAAGTRQRGTEEAPPDAGFARRGASGARAIASRAPAPTSPACRPRPRTRATTTW